MRNTTVPKFRIPVCGKLARRVAAFHGVLWSLRSPTWKHKPIIFRSQIIIGTVALKIYVCLEVTARFCLPGQLLMLSKSTSPALDKLIEIIWKMRVHVLCFSWIGFSISSLSIARDSTAHSNPEQAAIMFNCLAKANQEAMLDNPLLWRYPEPKACWIRFCVTVPVLLEATHSSFVFKIQHYILDTLSSMLFVYKKN